MESTGMAGRIQVSQKTADLLLAAGKELWLSKRHELVQAKGKGALVTYWLKPKTANTVTSSSSGKTNGSGNTTPNAIDSREACDAKIGRLVEWNFGVFKELLQQVHANRPPQLVNVSWDENIMDVPPHGCPIEEISETLEIPKVENPTFQQDLHLSEMVEAQLRDFIATIAHLYKMNAFHNFEHSSHVVMSTMKLLDRIRSQQERDDHKVDIVNTENNNKSLYLDPLTQLGIVFAALIHDADHLGMSNQQLMEENIPIATIYKNKSIAEQNSIDVAWNLLMQPTFHALRQSMFTSRADLCRFRQVMVNSVLATDIFDKDLKSSRDVRWEKVFGPVSTLSSDSGNDSEINNQRKNAIVIEHLMQASDVVHTMQHWKVYQKWNQRLFFETYIAYQQGHCPNNPVDGWYAGEIWFFDNYIIPLANKLRTCGVFGVSCDEFLDYAIDNRSEWERKGTEIVLEWEKEIKTTLPTNDDTERE
jgi:3'5'-cyclic nucleotide phosphodiesterase